MNQPSLFDSLERPAEPRPVRPEPIRKYLNYKLRILRRADHMPWSESEHPFEEKDFRRFAKVMPEEESQALLAEFEALTAMLTYLR
jgi:hypothetical protein